MDAQMDTDDILKCPICLEVYKYPKYLPCLHTFCQACLGSYILSAVKPNTSESNPNVEFNCPVCRVIVTVSDPALPVEEWANQFSTNHLIMTLLDKQKLQQNVKLCDPCQVDNKDVTAVFWCKVCNEALCEVCSNYHRKMMALRQHKLFNIAEQDKGSFDISRNEYCAVHKNKQLEAFCFDHDVACCVTCITINHRKCDHVTTLDDAAKDIRKKPELNEFQAKLSECEEVLSAIVQSKKQNLDDIQTQEEEMLKQVSQARTKIDNKLDKAQTKLTQDIKDGAKQHTIEINDVLFDLENQTRGVESHRKMFEACAKHATDVQVFLAMKRIEIKQKEAEEYVKLSLKSVERVDSELKSSKWKENISIDCFGTIYHRKRSIGCEILTSLEVPCFSKIMGKERSFTVHCSFTAPGTVADAIFLPDGRLAITTGSYKVYFCDKDGSNLSSLQFASTAELHGLVVYNENQLLVSRPSYDYIHFVDFVNKKDLRYFNVKGKYKGLAIFRNHIVASCKSELLVLSLNGTFVKEIGVRVDGITSNDDNIFITNGKTFSCITLEGEIVSEYQHPELIEPRGVTVDEHGNVFVAGYSSSNVHKVSPNGEHIKIVLSEKDGIKNPRVLSYDKDSKRLLVVHSDSKVIVYDKTW